MRQAYPTLREPTSLRKQSGRRADVRVSVTLFKRARFAFCFCMTQRHFSRLLLWGVLLK